VSVVSVPPIIVPGPSLILHVTVWPLNEVPPASVTVAVTAEVLNPSRRMLVLSADTDITVVRELTVTSTVVESVLPIAAEIVAVPADVLVSVAVALPSLSVVAGEVIVPLVEEKLTVLPAIGSPFVVSTAWKVIVVLSIPSSRIVDLSEEMLRVIPRNVTVTVPEPPLTEAWIVVFISVEPAASAVSVMIV